MYYILYNKKSLKVEHIYNKPLTAKVCDNFYEINGIAEYKGELPKGDYLVANNIHEEIETWKEKEIVEKLDKNGQPIVNKQGEFILEEKEVEKSKTHIVCDLVAHFYPKIEPSEKQLAAKRIQELKKLLEETDYQALKFAEGVFTAEEYEPIKRQRQTWRDEINELEKI